MRLADDLSAITRAQMKLKNTRHLSQKTSSATPEADGSIIDEHTIVRGNKVFQIVIKRNKNLNSKERQQQQQQQHKIDKIKKKKNK